MTLHSNSTSHDVIQKKYVQHRVKPWDVSGFIRHPTHEKSRRKEWLYHAIPIPIHGVYIYMLTKLGFLLMVNVTPYMAYIHGSVMGYTNPQ